MPVFSIVIPVYNAEKYLAQCVESVLAQTFRDFELILVHDITADRSGEICDRYAAADHRIIVFHGEKQGVSAARNRGIEFSTGGWLIFIDADDWVEPDMLEIALEHLLANDCDLLIFDAVFEYAGKSERVRFFSEPFISGDKQILTDIKKDLLYPKGIGRAVPWGRVFRTHFFHNFPLRFPAGIDVWEDIWFNFIYCGYVRNLQYISEPLYHYRQNEGSALHRYRADLKVQMLKSLSLGEDLLEGPDRSVFEQSFYGAGLSAFLWVLSNIMHKDSPMTFGEKLLEVRSLCEYPCFYYASRHVEKRNLPLRHKMVCLLIEKKMSFLLMLYNGLKRIFYWLKKESL